MRFVVLLEKLEISRLSTIITVQTWNPGTELFNKEIVLLIMPYMRSLAHFITRLTSRVKTRCIMAGAIQNMKRAD